MKKLYIFVMLVLTSINCFAQERTLISVKINNKWGFIDQNGMFAIEPQYDEVSEFNYGLAAVKRNNMWGFVDSSGAIAITPSFDWALDFCCNGLCSVKVGNKWGAIDKSGQIVIKPQFDF